MNALQIPFTGGVTVGGGPSAVIVLHVIAGAPPFTLQLAPALAGAKFVHEGDAAPVAVGTEHTFAPEPFPGMPDVEQI